ncbi:hypothetical protein FDP41_003695 [Naegleria fowleri]|uniref:Uncharacterized protein n=1 Tax=Naegleria fowleri TaxID=5763 RepID=A0A6A5BQR4_NAEFO|nr:uncharacterized protein FDP41_003695 [Naegleria fowleri]KAF0977042.1 hypothetical protein FDP41_003695 [Naegleria fowleri]
MKKTPLIGLCLLGSGAVGKSCLAVQYHHGIFEENDYDPTIQDVHRKNVRLNDKREYCLEIRDTAGEPELRGLLEEIIETSEGFMIVYSVLDKRSFEEVTLFLDMIWKVRGKEVPIMLVGNKIDTLSAEQARAVPREEAQRLAQTYQLLYQETSAKSGENVKSSFVTLAEKARDNMILTGKLKKPSGCQIA